MEIATWAALAALATKFVSFAKQALARDVGALTQLVAWGIGVGVAFLAANADLTETLVIPGTATPLGDLDAWSLVLAGLAIGSSGSLARDGIKAVDNTQSAAEPPLVKTKS